MSPYAAVGDSVQRRGSTRWYDGGVKRRLLSVATVVLLVCLLGAGAAWTTSYYGRGYLPSPPTNGGWRVRSAAGQLEVYRYQPPVAGLIAQPGIPFATTPAPSTGVLVETPHLRGMVQSGRGSSWTATMTTRYEFVGVRYLLLCFVLGITTAVVGGARFVMRRREPRVGICPTCGYDLRASPDRCPECGAAVVTRTKGNGSARIRTENQGIMSPLL